jgi:hypothetical protein
MFQHVCSKLANVEAADFDRDGGTGQSTNPAGSHPAALQLKPALDSMLWDLTDFLKVEWATFFGLVEKIMRNGPLHFKGGTGTHSEEASKQLNTESMGIFSEVANQTYSFDQKF